MKREVAIKDHIRRKKILFKHNETAFVSDIIKYLQSTYSHFRNKEISLYVHDTQIPIDATLIELFDQYSYTPKDMLEIRERSKEIIESEPEKSAVVPSNAAAIPSVANAIIPEKKIELAEQSPLGEATSLPGHSQDSGLLGEATSVFNQHPRTARSRMMQKDIDFSLAGGIEFSVNKEFSVQDLITPQQEISKSLYKAEKVFAILAQLQQKLPQKQTLKHILTSLLNAIFDFLPIQQGLVLLYDKSTGELKGKHEKHSDLELKENWTLSEKLILEIEERRMLMAFNVSSTTHFAIPLTSGKQLLGLIYLIGEEGESILVEETLQVLSFIASYSALAIENVILIEELEKLLAKGG